VKPSWLSRAFPTSGPDRSAVCRGRDSNPHAFWARNFEPKARHAALSPETEFRVLGAHVAVRLVRWARATADYHGQRERRTEAGIASAATERCHDLRAFLAASIAVAAARASVGIASSGNGNTALTLISHRT
jgi:hypothetical protein